MSIYRNLQRFARDIVHPYIVALRIFVKDEMEYVDTVIANLNALITSTKLTIDNAILNVRNLVSVRISAMTTYFTARATSLLTTISTHAADKNNPHKVSLDQMVTISTRSPIPTDGTTGDVWLKYTALGDDYSWVSGEWSECSADCDGGTQTRTVSCVNRLGVIVNDSYCVAEGLVKPVSLRECNTAPCLVPLVASNEVYIGGYSIETSNPMNSTAEYVTSAKIVIGDRQGTMRLRASHHDGGLDGFHSNLRLMKNGVQVGYWAADSATYVQRSIDVAVAPGDVFEWQHCGKNTLGTSYFRYDGVFATEQ